MSEPASISKSIAERYAVAVYELAKEANEVDRLEIDIDILASAMT
ncbi:MAG TPA: F0F1 ATP synthase subunit delta, partial [Rhodobacteraceae bacterium]|nr:F0F1 ATP synthase subunit delta [Paracoccaceae bacterium]